MEIWVVVTDSGEIICAYQSEESAIEDLVNTATEISSRSGWSDDELLETIETIKEDGSASGVGYIEKIWLEKF